MILVTGGTGFVGQTLIRHLVSSGYPVRLLLNPSNDSPRIPKGIPVDVAIAGINDERNLRAAMKGVQTVFHLIGTEWKGINADYLDTDVKSAEMFSAVAVQMNVERFFYLSHIGADRSSAYALLKAKAMAEAVIRDSGIPYTIIRTAVIYGQGDHFTESFARYIKATHGMVLLPGHGDSRIQPVWIEDLVTCLLLCMDDKKTAFQTLLLGGMEILTIRECVEMMMLEMGKKQRILNVSPVWLRTIIVALEQWFANFPRMYFWMDYLAEDRITALDVLPRDFGLMPARMSQNLSYLRKTGNQT
ncbi:MAG: SDR family oxidoreductase [Flexilinea sp.]